MNTVHVERMAARGACAGKNPIADPKCLMKPIERTKASRATRAPYIFSPGTGIITCTMHCRLPPAAVRITPKSFRTPNPYKENTGDGRRCTKDGEGQ